MENKERKALGGLLVNGQWHYFDKVRNLKRVPGSKARWTVERHGWDVVTYEIEGGRHAGGGRNEWYLDGNGFKACRCTSLVDALRLLENM